MDVHSNRNIINDMIYIFTANGLSDGFIQSENTFIYNLFNNTNIIIDQYKYRSNM